MSSQANKEEFEKTLQTFVGLTIGEPDTARDAVNESMIRHWCDAMGDENPVYTDADAAAASVHGGIVAPPSMMQAWMLPGIAMAEAGGMGDNKQTQLHGLFDEHGYTGVVATNCEQSYARYLRPGDSLTATTVIEAVSGEKATGLGIGYFINTRETFFDQNGEEVAWQTFRVLKFKPAQQAEPAGDSTSSAPEKPRRIRPPKGHDNTWWWEGVAEDKLLIQKCGSCETLRHPPTPMCPECQSLDWTGVPAAGRGTVYSYTVLHYPKFPGYEFPLVCALIELEEGTRVVSNVTGCKPDDVKIGMAVELFFDLPDGQQKLPQFRPAS